MKATKYIAAFALLLGLVACQPNELFNGGSNIDGDKVEVTLSVQFPEPLTVPTKAPMSESPDANAFDIYLCVYGPGNGAFQNWIKATDVTLTTDSDGKYVGTFTTFLPVADDQRTVHIFVNPPEGVTPVGTDYIDHVMEKMVTENGNGAYWQEIVLPNGIYPSPTNGLKAHQDIQDAFEDVQLLRNFAKIIVDGPYEDDEGQLEEKFTLKSWALINVPTKGYVAPYTRKEGGRARFPYGYSNAFLGTGWTASSLLTQLVETDDYKGFMPPVGEDENIINTDFPTQFFNNGQKTYMYERPVPDVEKPDEKQTAILIQIEFLNGHPCYDASHPDSEHNTYWYKIEVLNDVGAYVPILRNFVYKMHILGLEETGAATAQAAFDGPYYGNISASLETASLNELSNGTSQIHVDLLDYTYMSIPDDGKITLMLDDDHASQFWFVPDMQDGTKYYETTAGVCEITFEKVKVQGYEHAVNTYEVGTVAAGTQGTITITPNAIDANNMKKSIIRVIGKAEGGKPIYREITITLMGEPSFKHGAETTRILTELSPVTTGAGNAVNLQICLPEGLGSSIFPIQVRIEAENNTLSATSPKLPVTTGKTLFEPEPAEGQPDNRRNTFFYVYTINYSDYCWLNPLTKKYDNRYVFGNPEISGFDDDPYITFFTNQTGDNSTRIKITDMKGRFKEVNLTLGTVPEP